jgi:hypothetical protein
MGSASPAKGMKFLVNRVLDQAEKDGVVFDEVEARMLGFAEEAASAKDMKAAQVFERDYDDEKYEAKVAELLRRVYKRDKDCGAEDAWDEALTGLAEGDAYILAMLRRAGIESANPLSYWIDSRFLLGLLPSCTAAAAGLVIAFTPIGKKLVPNELLRLALFFLLLTAPLLIANKGRKTGE